MSKLGDPAEKEVIHRAGTQPVEVLIRWAKEGKTLAAGEGKAIVEHYEDVLNRIEAVLEGWGS